MKVKYMLGDISDVSAGQGAPQKESDFCNVGKPFIRAGSLAKLVEGYSEHSVCELINDDTAKIYGLRLYPKNTIIFAKSGKSTTKGYVHVLSQECYIVNHLACINMYNDNSSYMKYYFRYYKPNQLIKDDAYPSISLTDIRNMIVNIHNIQTQKEIVAVLDKVTLLISMRKEQLEKLDILVKSKFIEMFGDPVLNPKGWEKKKGNKLFNFTNGRFLNTNNRRESGIPVYGGNGVAWYTNEYFISFPTIIIGRVGEKCGNIHYSTGPIWVTDNAIYISQFLQNIFNLIYLSYEMDLLNFRSMAEGGGQPKITQKILNDCFYRVPPLELQNQFAEFVEQVEKNKKKIKSSLNQLETLYSALMQEYFG